MDPLLPLLGAVLWTLGLVFVVAGHRTVLVLAGKQASNAFKSGEPHGPDWYRRVNRAHMNCVENVPLFAAVVLAGHVAETIADPFGTLAMVWFLARIGQTLAHVSSGSAMAVNVRFTFFVIQHVCLIGMCLLVLDGLL